MFFNFSDHIDHIKNVASIDNVGLGGDYDGVPRCGFESLVPVTKSPIFKELYPPGRSYSTFECIGPVDVRLIRGWMFSLPIN